MVKITVWLPIGSYFLVKFTVSFHFMFLTPTNLYTHFFQVKTKTQPQTKFQFEILVLIKNS
jgi:hypothetical protein